MEMKGLNLINIGVSDLEKSKKFYCEVFGMGKVHREPHLIFLRCGKGIFAFARWIRSNKHRGYAFWF